MARFRPFHRRGILREGGPFFVQGEIGQPSDVRVFFLRTSKIFNNVVNSNGKGTHCGSGDREI